MTEKERCKVFILLLQDLVKTKNTQALDVLKTMVEKDTEAMQKSFQIMTERYFLDLALLKHGEKLEYPVSTTIIVSKGLGGGGVMS